MRAHLGTALYSCAHLHAHTPAHTVYTGKHLSMPAFTNRSSGEAGQGPNARARVRAQTRARERIEHIREAKRGSEPGIELPTFLPWPD